MLEDVVIIGIVMVIVEIIKNLCKKVMSEDAVKQVVVPLAVLCLAAGLNVAAGYVFTPDVPWRETLLQGLKLGAVAGGVYGLGKAALGKS